MIDQQTSDAPTEELTPEQKIQQRLDRYTFIHVGSQVWRAVPQSAKDGYYEGRKHHREQERMEPDEWDMLYWQKKLLDTHPNPTELKRYLNRVRPKHYTGGDAEQYDRYFIAGWYSRVFGIDCY